MDLGRIDKNKLFNQLDRTEKADKTERSTRASQSAKNKSAGAKSDKLQLSDIDLSSDIEFAQKALENLKKSTFENITEIRTRVKKGEFETKEVQNTVSKLISGKIAFMESLALEESTTAPGKKGAKTEVSPELRQKLTDNDEVLNAVSRKILENLINL